MEFKVSQFAISEIAKLSIVYNYISLKENYHGVTLSWLKDTLLPKTNEHQPIIPDWTYNACLLCMNASIIRNLTLHALFKFDQQSGRKRLNIISNMSRLNIFIKDLLWSLIICEHFRFCWFNCMILIELNYMN